MNLDDIKKNWKDIDNASMQSPLSAADIQLLIKKRNKKTRIKIFIPEVLMIFLHIYLIVILIVFNHQFDSLLFKALSWLSVLILIGQSALIYFTSRIFYDSIKMSNSYNQTLNHLGSECEKLNRRYSLILALNLVILLLCIVLLPRIYSENPSVQQSFIASIVGGIIISYFSYRIYRYYKNLILQNNYLINKLQKK